MPQQHAARLPLSVATLAWHTRPVSLTSPPLSLSPYPLHFPSLSLSLLSCSGS